MKHGGRGSKGVDGLNGIKYNQIWGSSCDGETGVMGNDDGLH